MRHFRNIVFTLAAFLWLPASAHCHLESIPGLDFFQCAVDDQPACDPGRDCDDCGCFALEKSQYNSTQIRLTIPLPVLQLVLFMPSPPLAAVLPVEVSLGFLATSPPRLLQAWQFAFRTALPVRAPSLAS